jgi:NAD(P)-dependent dehydrogenase (short-subunit alcohol dehydrogenase family)
MEGKVCLITGATAGIGLVTARELARCGARVIGVGRSPERCSEALRQINTLASGPPAEFCMADLSSRSEVERLAHEIHQRTQRLDVLLNNAGGIFLDRQETVDGLEMTFALNHLAYFLLTYRLLDLLKSSAPARVVCVASAAHQGAQLSFDDLQGKQKYRPWRAYQQSKLANILFTRELARRLEGTGVTANALHPGYVRTQIFRARGFAGWAMRRAADLFAISPERGARTSIYLTTSHEVEGTTGCYFVRCRAVSPSSQAQDDVAAGRLWEVSERLCGLSERAETPCGGPR